MSSLDIGSQNVASGDMYITEFFLEFLALSPLASSWWSGDDHYGRCFATTGLAHNLNNLPPHLLTPSGRQKDGACSTGCQQQCRNTNCLGSCSSRTELLSSGAHTFPC